MPKNSFIGFTVGSLCVHLFYIIGHCALSSCPEDIIEYLEHEFQMSAFKCTQVASKSQCWKSYKLTVNIHDPKSSSFSQPPPSNIANMDRINDKIIEQLSPSVRSAYMHCLWTLHLSCSTG